MKNMIDFTNCRVIPERTYNGANGSKIAVEYNEEKQTVASVNTLQVVYSIYLE